MKPILLGYQNDGPGALPEQVESGRRLLLAFALAEGYCLGEVFQERDSGHPLSAFAELIESVKRSDAVAVAVPSLMHLGHVPRVRTEIRKRLERETGVLVHVALKLVAPHQAGEYPGTSSAAGSGSA